MSQNINEKFTGVNSLNDHLIISNAENNLKAFLDWGFLNIGGFINVQSIPNVVSNNPNQLAIVDDPNYQTGQVWQTQYKDWVWEHGVVYGTSTPTLITNILVDGNVVNASDYILNYAESKVVFNNPIPSNSTVTMDFSYRKVQVYTQSNDLTWWRQYQIDSANGDQFLANQGDYTIFTVNRIQLPAIIIEAVPRGIARPYQLGNKSLIVDQDFIFHIVCNTYSDRNAVVDILRLQQDKVIWLYDIDKIIENNIQPFLFDGSLNPDRAQYDNIVKNPEYQWKTGFLKNMVLSEVESGTHIQECKLRMTLEIIFSDISA